MNEKGNKSEPRMAGMKRMEEDECAKKSGGIAPAACNDHAARIRTACRR
jgi:hypothetical protein